MISITRRLARDLRAVFRRTGLRRGQGPTAWVAFLAEAGLLRIQLTQHNVAVEHRVVGDFQPERLLLPYEFLADCEGAKDDPVVLESQGGKTLVRWSDRGVPQMVALDPPPPKYEHSFPSPPETLQPCDPAVWSALHDAAQNCASERVRYAIDCVQLQGGSRRICGADGHHMLMQNGFSLPWKENVLIPASGLLGCRDLDACRPVSVGKTNKWTVFELGDWSIYLPIDGDSRYPRLDDLLRPVNTAPTRLELSEADCRFLLTSLPKLPGEADEHRPITLDLNGQVVIRSTTEQIDTTTELLLSGSRSHGEPLLANTNRRFLSRAVELGFREVHFFGAEKPAFCDDGRRQYVWMLLNAEGALRPKENAIRLDSGGTATPPATIPISRPKREAMPTKTTETQAEPAAAAAPKPSDASAEMTAGAATPIAQAESLRTALRDALAQTNDLIASLKRQKRQSKLVKDTLAALQELRSVG